MYQSLVCISQSSSVVERLVVTLKIVSSNLAKGKYIFFIIENKVTESMTMVASSGEQIKSLKSYIKMPLTS